MARKRKPPAHEPLPDASPLSAVPASLREAITASEMLQSALSLFEAMPRALQELALADVHARVWENGAGGRDALVEGLRQWLKD